MEKYNNFFKNMAKVVEAGLISSKDLKKELENTLKIKIEEMVNKLNLVSREEFEIQKKLIEKLQNKINTRKKKNKKKLTKRARRV